MRFPAASEAGGPRTIAWASGVGGIRSSPDGESVGAKRRMVAEIVDTLRKDPFGVQFLRPWVWSLLPGHGPLRDELPWMNFRVIRWLRTYLRPTMTAFEYGAGGSTIFLAKRIHRLYSVEHDRLWYDLVAEAIRAQGIANCELRLVPSEPRDPREDVSYGPRSFTSRTPGALHETFEAYVRSIDAHPDGMFDLVIVDGYARFSCVARAIPKVKRGGFLLLDDTDWPKYREAADFLSRFPRVDFVGVTPFQRNLRQTTIWRL